MQTFNKSRKLDNVLYDVRGPVVEEADRMIAQGVDVDLDDDPPAPEQLPDVVLRTPDQIVRSLTFMAIEHNIAVKRRTL